MRPKHIEVQILGDNHGNLVHLFERDCSVQRRHQKVVEYAPAWSLPPGAARAAGRRRARRSRATSTTRNAGTVEFLVGEDGTHYFIEVNPRIQVEHTVTEAITGRDLVQAQIRIAQGYRLSDPEIGIASQADIQQRGVAIQVRVTAEDPRNDFLPDTGKITVYRPAVGIGIRLDDGSGYVGARVSQYYDSLLVKITRQRPRVELRPAQGGARAARVPHPRRQDQPRVPRERAVAPDVRRRARRTRRSSTRRPSCSSTRRAAIARRASCATSARPSSTATRRCAASPSRRCRCCRPSPAPPPVPRGAAAAGHQAGAGAAQVPRASCACCARTGACWLTDTTWRDAHQSLLATRLRSYDMARVAHATAHLGAELFSHRDVGRRDLRRRLPVPVGGSVGAAGGAAPQGPRTSCSRCWCAAPTPSATPTTPTTSSAAFIEEAAAAGIDVFRIFDALNDVDSMQVAIEAAQKSGTIVETAICYTGDVSDPRRKKYDLKYYVDLAKEVVPPRHAPAGDQGHGGAAQAARRDDAGQGAEGRGRRAAAPAHARHVGQQHRDLHGRDRSRRRRRRRRRQQHGGHDVAAVAVVAGVRAAGVAARSGHRPRRLRAAVELLGAGARVLRAVRVGPERARRRRLRARDPGRPVLEPARAGRGAGRRRRLGGRSSAPTPTSTGCSATSRR